MLRLGDPPRDDVTCKSYAPHTVKTPKRTNESLTTVVGNAVLTQTLVTCEVSVALIGACLPSIFSLVKHVCSSLRHTNKAYFCKSTEHGPQVENKAGQVTSKQMCRIRSAALSAAEAGLVIVEVFR